MEYINLCNYMLNFKIIDFVLYLFRKIYHHFIPTKLHCAMQMNGASQQRFHL